MKVFGALTFVMLLTTVPAFTAEQTWTAQISDSMCRKVHPEDADAAAGGKQGEPEPHDCTLSCVRGGSKFVMVADDKVFQIANQDLPALTTHAGHEGVKISGELKGDVVTITKIEMAADGGNK